MVLYTYTTRQSRSPALITPRASLMAVACRTKLRISAVHSGRQGCVGERRDCGSGRTQLHINVCKFPPLLLTKIRKINFMDAETILMSSGGEERHAINSSLPPREKRSLFKYQSATSVQGRDGSVRKRQYEQLSLKYASALKCSGVSARV